MGRIWRFASSLAFACAVLALLGARADAETAITTQAVADDGAFLPYAPPPAQPAGLCLVDTGVNLNPDTEGEVVERTAIDAGSGNDVSPETHGTLMAMMAAAPANGWGIVGTAPAAIRIVSVRILEPGHDTFPFSSYAAGISDCLELRKRYDVKVINLSLGSSGPQSNQSQEAAANAVQEANDYGVAVLAAAGNDDGGPVEYPAAYPLVLSVGAIDAVGGAFCAFSSEGEGLRLTAPGCDLDAADPTTGAPDYDYSQGTSEASAIAAAALAALDSYRPELSPQAAEGYLTAAHGDALDIAQAFRNAGLGTIVAAGEAAEPDTQTAPGAGSQKSPGSVAPSGPMGFLTSFKRPRARLERITGRLTLVLVGRPSEARAQVRCLGYRPRSRHLSTLRTITGAFTTLALPAGATAVSVRYTDPYDVERDGPWATLMVSGATKGHAQGRQRR
jgi:hypothetical protein